MWPEPTLPDALCEVAITLDEKGQILTTRVVKSQGHADSARWCFERSTRPSDCLWTKAAMCRLA